MPLAVLGTVSATGLIAITLRVDSIDAPGLRAALGTTMTLFAVAAVWLLRAEFASSRRLRDLLLLAAAMGLGLMSFSTDAVPAALNLRTAAFFSDAELWGQLGVAALFVAAAFTPSHRLVVRSAHPLAASAVFGVSLLAVAFLGVLLLGSPREAGPFLFALAVIGTGPMVYAAVGFARRRGEIGDRAAGLLTATMLLLAGASLVHLMTRGLSAGRFGPDEAVRALACALLLSAAVTFERRDRRRLARTAALTERRRVARDLHDGLAQDLALIAAHERSIAGDMGDDHPVVTAARRALSISRSTISELTDPEGASAHECLAAVAHELRDRFNVTIAVESQLDADLHPHAREHLSRIAREAIANAARHGHARNVVVSLRQSEGGVALRVVDDGCGIVDSDSDFVPEGFGLRSMRERADALGGYVRIGPARRGGTELEVVLP